MEGLGLGMEAVMRFMQNKTVFFSSKAVKRLLLCALFYMAVPQMIFMSICLKRGYAILTFILTLAALWAAWKVILTTDAQMKMPLRVLVVMELMIAGLFLFSGTGGICGQQMADYTRSNAILSDLVFRKWPVVYEEYHNISVMNYYIAYFIPGAFAGRLLNSFHAAELVTLLWSVLGLNIGILLIFLVAKAVKIKTLWLFFCWAGLDCLGQVIVSGTLFKGMDHLEHWANIEGTGNAHIANYQSVASGFLWGPQHYISAIIVCFFMLYMVRQGIYKLCMLLAVMLLFWSPLAAIGIFPFTAVFLVHEKGNVCKFLSKADLLGCAGIGAPIVFYYLSMNLKSSGAREDYIRDIRWLLQNWTILLLFIVLEFGIAGYIIWKTNGSSCRLHKLLCVTALAAMTVFLFVDWGLCHDFSMRASIIPWLVLFSFVPEIFETADLKWKKALLFYMVGATVTSCTEYARILEGMMEHPFAVSRAVLAENTISGWDIQYQYVGMPDAFFFSKLCDIDFDAGQYMSGLQNSVNDCLLYSDEIWNVYFYENVLYFLVKDDHVQEPYVSISMTFDNEPVRTVNYALDDMIKYGTLSAIDHLGLYHISETGWRELDLLLSTEKGPVSLHWSEADFIKQTTKMDRF